MYFIITLRGSRNFKHTYSHLFTDSFVTCQTPFRDLWHVFDLSAKIVLVPMPQGIELSAVIFTKQAKSNSRWSWRICQKSSKNTRNLKGIWTKITLNFIHLVFILYQLIIRTYARVILFNIHSLFTLLHDFWPIMAIKSDRKLIICY